MLRVLPLLQLALATTAAAQAKGLTDEPFTASAHHAETPLLTNPYWNPGPADLVRVRPNIGSTVFDVTKYGAKGDGVTDDHKAIQAALDACVASHDGGVVLLPNTKVPPPSGPPPRPTPLGANSEPAVPPLGLVYVSLPVTLDHATGCAIIIEKGVTLLEQVWGCTDPKYCPGGKNKPDRYKGAHMLSPCMLNCARAAVNNDHHHHRCRRCICLHRQLQQLCDWGRWHHSRQRPILLVPPW